jgi:IS30 family transposase
VQHLDLEVLLMSRGVEVRRGVREAFWALLRGGVHPDIAAAQVGVSVGAGRRWLADRGGVIPSSSRGGRAGCRYHRLTFEQRETIGLMLAAGQGDGVIAAAVGCERTTIWRERRRNGNRDGGYRPSAAQKRAEQRASTTHRQVPKLATPGPLRDYVTAGLKQLWSPQEIAYRIRMDHRDDPDMRVCAETIYQSLFVQARGGLKRELSVYLRTQRERRRPQARSRNDERRGKLVETISIRERPAEATDRAVPGHWEGDLIVGRDNGSAIGTLVERSTRFVMLIHLPGRRTAQEFHDAIVPTINTLPEALKRSLTWDNGKEMAMHRQITLATDMKIYFADPRSPWQRGSNENTNGLLRQYFPKGISLRQFNPEHLAAVARQLNGRPRETLDWHTPAEALNQLLGHPFEPPVLH